jgi:hypothetical protein
VEGAKVGRKVNRSLAATAEAVLESRRTTVSSMDLIVNLKRLSGRLIVAMFRGYLQLFPSNVKGIDD